MTTSLTTTLAANAKTPTPRRKEARTQRRQDFCSAISQLRAFLRRFFVQMQQVRFSSVAASPRCVFAPWRLCVNSFALAAAAAVWLVAGQPVQAAPARPNFLWLIAEDFGQHLSCYGTKEVWTPNLD